MASHLKNGDVMRYKFHFRSAIPALCAVAFAIAPETSAHAANWKTSEATSALTGAADISASLDSTQPLANMLGLPQPATLIMRCSGGQLATYVVWPQVLSIGAAKELTNTPQTMVLWRIDNANIRADFWDRSTDGTAAGKFSTGGAVKILRPLAGARRLVVRMTGNSTQDAVFDLGEVDPIIAKIEQTCGVTSRNSQ